MHQKLVIVWQRTQCIDSLSSVISRVSVVPKRTVVVDID